jgi:hypothetical protein
VDGKKLPSGLPWLDISTEELEMATDKEVHLKIVVNGKAIPMKSAPDALLGALVVPTLEKAKVPDRSEPDRWIFTDASGQPLDKNKPVGSFGFSHDQEISLSLGAGVVG